MAVHLPPGLPAIIDYGNAPEIWIDGLAHYAELDGIVRTSFYANQPIHDGSGDVVRAVVLKFVCTVSTQRKMRDEIAPLSNGPSTLLKLVKT